MFIREKKISCGRYMEVDIIPRTETAEVASRGKRGKRKKVTEPKQNALNDKNAKRYFIQLCNGNFGRNDLHVSCTYDEDHLPGTVEEAEREARNYLRRIDYRRRKLGLDPLKYILVTEYAQSEDGTWLTRVHHHIIMSRGLPREEVELMWTKDRINWKRVETDAEYTDRIVPIGYANADRIQPDANGIEALARYITKNQRSRSKKRYSSSRNLKRPETERRDSTEKETRTRRHWRHSRELIGVYEKCNDYKYSYKRVMRLAQSPDAGYAAFKSIYKGYEIVDIEPVYYEETGWHIYLKMWKEEKRERKEKKKE